MDTRAELVREVLRWSLQIILAEEARGTRHPGPRLSRVSLGDMLARGDAETAIDIARDIDSSLPHELLEQIRSQWGATRPTAATTSRSARTADQVFHASDLVASVRRHAHGEERRLLEQASTVRTWVALTTYWPGRDPYSLRDDFERIAKKTYDNHKKIICATADFIVSSRYAQDTAPPSHPARAPPR